MKLDGPLAPGETRKGRDFHNELIELLARAREGAKVEDRMSFVAALMGEVARESIRLKVPLDATLNGVRLCYTTLKAFIESRTEPS